MPYPLPAGAELWAHQLIRSLEARDRDIDNRIRPQTAFLATSELTTAYSSASPATVVFGTEATDTGGRYDAATGTYSAPLKGVYHFTGKLGFDNTADADTEWLLTLVTDERTYELGFVTPGTANPFTVEINCPCVLMDRGDTAKIQLARASGSGTVTLAGDAGRTQFAGHMVEFA